MRRFVYPALAALLLSAPPAAAQQRNIFDDVQLEVIPETNGADPYPNELVLLRIRGVYRPLINLMHMVQPDLVNFGWTNLTPDTTRATEMRGFPAVAFERVMAVYPEKTGPLTIGSFTHKLTVVDGMTNRVIEVKSKPVTVNVATWVGPGGPTDRNGWWLPASGVRIIDNWSADPNRVKRGETVRRTVTIEADGVTAEQLPPPPVMSSPGIISFRGPNDRESRVTENGPVSRAVYRWDMRPTTAHPATMQPIAIKWFDTRSRTLREAIIPAQRLAWAVAAPAAGEAATPAAPERASLAAAAGVGALALAIGLAVLFVGAGENGFGPPRLPPRALWRMRFAALRGDAAGVRAAITELARRTPGAWLAASEVRGPLAELDRHLYHPGSSPRPGLRRLARLVAAAWRSAGAAARPARSALAPLDGPWRPG